MRITNYEDLIMKRAMDVFAEDGLKFFGIDKKVKELGPTELVVLESKNLHMDYTFLMEDDTYIHFEFQTTNKNISDLRRFRAYEALLSHQTGKDVVTLLSNGTTAYNCFNYAWLYYDSKNKDKYWKKCRINNVSPYLNDNHYASSNSASPYYKIASNGAHAAVVCSTSVSYYDSKGQLKTEPLVKSKWSANGHLLKNQLNLYQYYPSGVKYYC